MEAEIQRKKEHVNFATNFEKSRGFVRTNWKSKNFDPKNDPCAESSSTDESQIAALNEEERHDNFDDNYSPNKKKGKDDSPEPLNELVDLSQSSDHPSSRPDVETQLETLKAIQEYNKKLPKRRKIKDKIGECSTSNITATYTVLRKPKKKNGDKPPPELITHYKPVGITDGCRSTSWSQDKYSLCNKQDAIQRSASAIKIRTLRTQY